MDRTGKAVAFLNDKDQAIWSIPPGLLPDLIEQSPGKAKPLIESTEHIAAIAAQLQQWDALEQAIRFLMACQQAVLDWWGNNVLRRGEKISQERGRLATPAAEKVIGFSDSVLSRWRQSLEKPEGYEERLRQAARRKAGLEPEPNRVSPNSGEYEWYTPAVYIEAARQVMGGIDLDPATSEVAQQTVKATEYYTAKDNGLSLSWHGRVWLNPPYSQPLIGQFISKLNEEYAAGSVEQAIMVTNNCTDTEWFHRAVAQVARMCFSRGRIRFANPERPTGESPLQGQTFFYYGNNAEAFRQHFGMHGFIVGPG